ncbi:hypothetical protein CKF54_07565 [Psittacicella hinzii]|uniref:Capsular polysaccharide export protein n=1 Tax=Psittacicella hinzii TaxID=2028575 RepID=A0A3A1Y1M2_9GAMM|nr:capsular biosynthesis protein [Psittacicella hinzii]RIY31128.1 hypothetical protein CKF54_07565 [Psittacicella hinzii]
MTNHNLSLLASQGQRFLLLQGPIGNFFADLSKWLTAQGKHVVKVNFNGGDEHYYPGSKIKHTYGYHDVPENFRSFLTYLVQKEQIDSIVCFGDCRFYHRQAKALAKELGLNFWVFEEGYYRPFYITLEKDGVNAYSPLPREASFFAEHNEHHTKPASKSPGGGFLPMLKVAVIYYIFMWWHKSEYKYYKHHRASGFWFYIKSWLKALWRYWFNYPLERWLRKRIEDREYNNFFVFPLQMSIDSQIKVHSKKKSIEAYISYVLSSFAKHAPRDSKLILKHHPLDRGFNNYRKYIKQEIARYPSLRGRVTYIQGLALPILMRKALGVIVVNSTSGMSSLIHHLPTYVLGEASYNIAGLTYQGSLDDFWTKGTPPDEELEKAYRFYHLYHTQINGNFYTKVFLEDFLATVQAEQEEQTASTAQDANAEQTANTAQTGNIAQTVKAEQATNAQATNVQTTNTK